MAAEFFALLRSGEVRMLPLRQDIQEMLSNQFEAAAARFLNPDVTLIPLGNDAFRPDESEIWVIEEFELPETLVGGVSNVMTLPPLRPTEVTGLQVKSVGARFSRHEGGPLIAIQAINRQQVITPTGSSIVLDRGTFRHLAEPGLQLGPDVHVVHDQRGLLFASVHVARRVFDIGDYYREATNADVKAFIQQDKVAVEDPEGFMSNADDWVRRRVALITDADVLASCSPRVVRERAAEYGVDIQVRRRGAGEGIVLPDEKRELKRVLKFLSEDMYKGPLTQTYYESNSKRRLAR